MNSVLPDINKDFSEWYNEVIYQAELADHSPIRGCIVIRPYGWSIWENIKNILDARIKETGHENASFPLLIPESFLKREAQHVEGFSPELAIVTIAGGKKLEEPLVVRPTSETIIHYMFARWIKSWRDLPLKVNQWANVVRWEMRTRPFLRTTEFFWQEGHTAHETFEQAEEEAQLMLHEYINLAQNYLAIPVIAGQKPESEKFAGADKTFTFEAIMQDGKALQMGTSHLISQNFAKAFDMVYQDREGKSAYPYLTSWGVTTRLIGALVMTHGDQKGLIIPPKVAPIQVIIIPIFKKENKDNILDTANKIKNDLIDVGIRAKIDEDEQKSPGSKFYKWELKGVPLRIEIGPKDLEKKQVILVDRVKFEKNIIDINSITESVKHILDNVQQELFDRAQKKVQSMWHKVEKLNDFVVKLDQEGGAFQAGWCQSLECEQKLKEHKATIRCLLNEKNFNSCFNCDRNSVKDIIIAKSY